MYTCGRIVEALASFYLYILKIRYGLFDDRAVNEVMVTVAEIKIRIGFRYLFARNADVGQSHRHG